MPDHAPSASRPRRIVVIGASAGGVKALMTILSSLAARFPAPIAIVQHRSAQSQQRLVEILTRITHLRVIEAKAGDELQNGTVYVAHADEHLTVTGGGCLAYFDGQRIQHLLSSANPLFASSAEVFGAGAVAVVLTGSGSDGTEGVLAVKAHGGIVIVQDEATSEYFSMPRSAIESGAVDMVLPLDAIGPELHRLFPDQEPAEEESRR